MTNSGQRDGQGVDGQDGPEAAVPAGAGEEGRGGARGYSWPPFEPGHTLSTRHGAYSPRRVEPLAAELVELALADPHACAGAALPAGVCGHGRGAKRRRSL
jgi:hypothetical protein